ncbi:hypothetical protein MMC25_006705 [Agyrium rufum]|nr:hypothetical protein [Agyrium rufum]
MGFGVGIGDVIAVSTLAWTIYKSCKNASGDFQNLASEVVSLHVVLKETEELIAESTPTSNQKTQIGHLADGCRKVLEDLEALLNKYRSLGTKSQRTWDRLKWGSEDIANIRTRLISNTTMISAYNVTVMNSSVAHLQRQLNQFMEEVRAGKRECSVISSTATVPDQNDNEGWTALRRELEDIGVTYDTFSQHKQFIVQWFQRVLSDEEHGGIFAQSQDIGLSNQKEEQKATFPENRIWSSETSELRSSVKNYVPYRSVLVDGDSLLNKAFYGYTNAIDYLLLRGVDPNYVDSDLGSALQISAMHGHARVVQRLLTQPSIEVNHKNKRGDTPLSLASRDGHLEVVDVLCTHPLTMIESTDHEYRQTPLSLAIERGHYPMVEKLLSVGANPNSQDKYGQTPLICAAKRSGPQETKLLLDTQTIDPNIRDHTGLTALTYIVLLDNDAIVNLLLSHRKVVLDAEDLRRLIFHAKFNRNSNIVALLNQEKDRTLHTLTETNSHTTSDKSSDDSDSRSRLSWNLAEGKAMWVTRSSRRHSSMKSAKPKTRLLS